jgi:methenyltetrahydromethanopterin cyclohydrolase
MMLLNELAVERCRPLIERPESFAIGVSRTESGVRILDCGDQFRGGIQAGLALAEVCMAGLGRVQLTASQPDIWTGPSVQVVTDHPVEACMASQYAGWQIAAEGYFAMGSGPMRAARGREDLFQHIGFKENPGEVVGVLESGRIPPDAVCQQIAADCGVAADRVTLLVAPTSSLAGTIQVVARTVETCLHKMHELGFDLSQVFSGYGIAPLPPVAAEDLVGIGRTNDAVLYGGQVTLWLRGNDDDLQQLGPRIPSCASPDFGAPFAKIFQRYDYDFYKIDPLLFSPAQVTLINLNSGDSHRFGQWIPDVLRQSFAG